MTPVESVIERVARALYEAMEHYDPSPDDEGEWDALTDRQRAFYRHSVSRALVFGLAPGDRLPGGRVVVPEEPTEAMQKIGDEMMIRREPTASNQVWRSMVSFCSEGGEG